MAARTLQGYFSELVHSLVGDLIRLRTLVESTLDFSEDDIVLPSKSKIDTCLINLINRVEYVLAEAHQGERMSHGMNIVIAGRPNVGKSTLLNTLLNNEAAIVNALPGTTRDVLRFDMQVDGLPIVLVDTAGIRETEDPIESEGIRRARKQFETADVILWVFDGNFSLEMPEITCLPDDVKLILIRNKIDLIEGLRDDDIPADYSFLAMSALTGQGIDLLKFYIRDISGIGDLGEGSFIARQRHIYSLEKGLESLRNAYELINCSFGSEVVSIELLEAQRAFDEITGKFTTDDLLGEIFSSFCIGK
jgi:tRNA modification GTPase